MSKSDKKSRAVPKEQAATLTEVDEAFRGLTNDQLVSLEKYANLKAQAFGDRAYARDGRDLLQEAFAAAFAGTLPDAEDNGHSVRRWNKSKVDFFGFMRGAIRGIASNWRKKRGPDEDVETSFIERSEDGVLRNKLRAAESPLSNPEETLNEAEPSSESKVTMLERHFEENFEASMILEGWKVGMTLPEIIKEYELDEKKAKAADRSLRRKIDGMVSKGKLNG